MGFHMKWKRPHNDYGIRLYYLYDIRTKKVSSSTQEAHVNLLGSQYLKYELPESYETRRYRVFQPFPEAPIMHASAFNEQ